MPLSNAICCRPCLPTDLPAPPAASGDQPQPAQLEKGSPPVGLPVMGPQLNDSSPRPIAVVWIGCHPSTGRQLRALQCEQNGNSYVTGARCTVPCATPAVPRSSPLSNKVRAHNTPAHALARTHARAYARPIHKRTSMRCAAAAHHPFTAVARHSLPLRPCPPPQASRRRSASTPTTMTSTTPWARWGICSTGGGGQQRLAVAVARCDSPGALRSSGMPSTHGAGHS